MQDTHKIVVNTCKFLNTSIIPVIITSCNYTDTHDMCVQAPLPMAADGKAALCDLGEVLVASGLLLPPPNRLLTLSTPRSLPTVINVRASFHASRLQTSFCDHSLPV